MFNNAAKAFRAQQARETVIQVIPRVLQKSKKAQDGVANVKLLRIDDLEACKAKASAEDRGAGDAGKGSGNGGMTIRIVNKDTLAAAHMLLSSNERRSSDRVAILNMASPLCPGGGFLNGATAQEESLCMRNKGCVYTPDICVFRGRYGQDQANEESHHQPHPADKVNPPKEWWYVDVITSAALRQPEVLSDVSRYAKDQDREIMREGMRLVLRAAMLGGCRKIVLGAWGCGAYGNPVQEVAQLWKRVLLGRGGHGKTEFAEWFEQVVFAIVGGPSKNLRVFNETFAAV